MNKKIEVDADFLLKLARGFDGLKGRVDYLESQLCDDPESPPTKNHLHINVTLSKASSPAVTQHKMEQFRLELLSLLDEYGVEALDGRYQRR